MGEATGRTGANLRRVGLYALAVVIVASVGLFLIGRYQLGQAQRVRRDAEIKLSQATIYIANEAMWAASAAQEEVRARNWGRARKEVGRAVQGIQLMEQIAPKRMQKQVGDLRRKARDAETAVGRGSEESIEMIADLLQSLQGLRERALTG